MNAANMMILSFLLDLRGTHFYTPAALAGALSFTFVLKCCIWYSPNNLNSSKVYQMKFIHNFRNHKRKAKFNFRLYHFFPFRHYAPVYLSWKWGYPYPMATFFFFLIDPHDSLNMF